jgi:hypothetical protein
MLIPSKCTITAPDPDPPCRRCGYHPAARQHQASNSGVASRAAITSLHRFRQLLAAGAPDWDSMPVRFGARVF